ncbi:hypothetical protein LTR27_011966 [Elasticomyces elasticus]|nr:hypothetical protein LTR27_011966 [Elasticomyces elasticus]
MLRRGLGRLPGFRHASFILDQPEVRFVYGASKYMLLATLGYHITVEYFVDVAPAYGISMLPTMASHGDSVVMSKWFRRGRGLRVGDLVSFRHPINMGESAVKRILGMPGDFVAVGGARGAGMGGEGGGGDMLQVPAGHCWIVGDNLTWSRDSRIYGALPLGLVTGKVLGVVSWKEGWRKLDSGLQEAVVDDEVD